MRDIERIGRFAVAKSNMGTRLLMEFFQGLSRTLKSDLLDGPRKVGTVRLTGVSIDHDEHGWYPARVSIEPETADKHLSVTLTSKDIKIAISSHAHVMYMANTGFTGRKQVYFDFPNFSVNAFSLVAALPRRIKS